MQTEGETPQRPNGLVFLALLHMIFGVGLALLMLMGLLVGSAATKSVTLPLEWLLSVSVPLGLGVVVGAAMLRGRPWAWHASTLTYLAMFLTAALSVIQALLAETSLFEAMLPEAVRYVRWIGYGVTALMGVAGLAAYQYMVRAAPRGYFALAGRPLWQSLAVHAAVALVVLVWGTVQMQHEVRQRTIDSLHRIGESQVTSEEGVAFMLERLVEGNAEERLSAAWALGRSGRTEAVAALEQAIRDDPDSNVRINALQALGGLVEDPGELHGLLLALLSEDDEQIQAAAVRGLAEEVHAAAAPRVGALLVDGSDALRPLAADALGAMGNGEAAAFLRQAVGDPEEEVRSRVAFALGKLADASAVPLLVGMIDDERWEVRANAAQALGMIGDASARAALEKAVGDRNAQVRWAAEAALDKLP